MRRAFYIAVFAAFVPAMITTYPSLAAAKSKPKPDMTFIGQESVFNGLPCSAAYTDKSLATVFCTVYTGTISGPAIGKGWSAATINITITNASARDSTPVGCHGMYLNIQFSNGTSSDMQTMYGFGSVCGPDNNADNFHTGADLTGSGGWGQIGSNGNGTGLGTFAATFTPEKGVTGDNLVITFQKAAQGQ